MKVNELDCKLQPKPGSFDCLFNAASVVPDEEAAPESRRVNKINIKASGASNLVHSIFSSSLKQQVRQLSILKLHLRKGNRAHFLDALCLNM